VNKVAIIILSKNRAMQLDCCLRTLKENCLDLNCENGEETVSVLIKTDKAVHQISYIKLAQEYPNINFINEINFKEDLLRIVKDKDYVLFICDDNVFTHLFSLAEMIDALKENPYALGFSLRLGTNIEYCYSLDK
jgi:hypothetical protein